MFRSKLLIMQKLLNTSAHLGPGHPSLHRPGDDRAAGAAFDASAD